MCHILRCLCEKHRDFRCFNLENILELVNSDDISSANRILTLQKYWCENFGVFRDAPWWNGF